MQFLENGQYILLKLHKPILSSHQAKPKTLLHVFTCKPLFYGKSFAWHGIISMLLKADTWQTNASTYPLSKNPNTMKNKYIKFLEMTSGYFKCSGNSLPPLVSWRWWLQLFPFPLAKKKKRLIWNHISSIISSIISHLSCCCWDATVNELSEVTQNNEVCKFSVQVHILKRL